MVVGVHTVEVLSLERTSRRLIDQLHTLLVGSVCIFLLLWQDLTSSAAKSLVSAGLARRALVQLSYAIGVAEPLSVYVDTYGTGKRSDEELVQIIRRNWDLRPGVIGTCLWL